MNDIKNVFESKRATTTSTTTAAITIDADNIKNIENKRVDNHTTLLDSQSIVDKKSTSMIKMYYQPKRNKPTKYSKGHCNKPFNIDCFCDICCKVFSRKYDRDRHYRIHLNIYPYSCKVCYKRFIRSDYVINHVRTTSCGQSDYYIDKYKQSSIKTKK
ncbi:hypothetical protein BCR36DRAFT_587009 [Piromyces finnis]|uniref:C2H2-type domain-containing protein n=1 Tax=Piromyces finnis TaxID=1754191 RepID=A0A1Y1UX27_9FUNG|nr:hypothetical protein BCR36DRAFT_587009 [Piromyces finnis]|eukprot:ORX42739.1 hypothetical protein BCR36DRAFT_587009 [Piromyces finnis]